MRTLSQSAASSVKGKVGNANSVAGGGRGEDLGGVRGVAAGGELNAVVNHLGAEEAGDDQSQCDGPLHAAEPGATEGSGLKADAKAPARLTDGQDLSGGRGRRFGRVR